MPDINYHNMLPEGSLLEGRYRIEKYLSSGGCGNTYLAKDTKFRGSKSRVVVKEFFLNGITHRDPSTSRVIVSNSENVDTYQRLLRKFRDEADRINELQHPNIVRVSDVFDANDTSYYVMDYIQGGSLASSAGKLTERQAVKYVRQVLRALEVVHQEGLYHLDIKPANVMLDQYDNAILIDFGASKMLGGEEGHTLSSTILYTKGYAPSEQMYRDLELIGPWTDLYAVGATLFNLLTNQTPPSPSVLVAKKQAALTMPNASEAVHKFVYRCMQNDVSARPQSVQEALGLLDAVDAVAQEKKPEAAAPKTEIPEPLFQAAPVEAPTVELDKKPAEEKPQPPAPVEAPTVELDKKPAEEASKAPVPVEAPTVELKKKAAEEAQKAPAPVEAPTAEVKKAPKPKAKEPEGGKQLAPAAKPKAKKQEVKPAEDMSLEERERRRNLRENNPELAEAERTDINLQSMQKATPLPAAPEVSSQKPGNTKKNLRLIGACALVGIVLLIGAVTAYRLKKPAPAVNEEAAVAIDSTAADSASAENTPAATEAVPVSSGETASEVQTPVTTAPAASSATSQSAKPQAAARQSNTARNNSHNSGRNTATSSSSTGTQRQSSQLSLPSRNTTSAPAASTSSGRGSFGSLGGSSSSSSQSSSSSRSSSGGSFGSIGN